MGLFSSTPKPLPPVVTNHHEEKCICSKKGAMPNFITIYSKVRRDDPSALGTLDQHVLTRTNFEKLLEIAKKEAEKDVCFIKSKKRGFASHYVSAGSNLVPITSKTALEMPLDDLWNTVIREKRDWWGFTLTCSCNPNGAKAEWHIYVNHIHWNDARNTMWVNQSLPLPEQLKNIGDAMSCMIGPRMILALRLCFEIARMKHTKDQQEQFVKMCQFLFPDYEFYYEPTLYMTSPWLNDNQAKGWNIRTGQCVAFVPTLDITEKEDYDIIYKEMRNWCQKMATRFTPLPTDPAFYPGKENETFNPVKFIDRDCWEQYCVPIIEKERTRARVAKVRESE